MRSIQVSTDAFAAIWADRQPGENSEDDIILRKFGVASVPAPTENHEKVGFSDPRFGIELPEGFEIFRTYRGKEYRAQAVNGSWKLLNTGQFYSSLNQLSRAVGTKVENAWQNWYFKAPEGQRRLVNSLRR